MSETRQALWQAMDRAHEAVSALNAREKARAEKVYRFTLGFTVPAAVCRDLVVETVPTSDGLHFEIEFFGTDEARRKVCDVVASLPTVCRSYHRYYDEGGV